jgi:DNA-binding MarR family transcriptional regulator
MTYHAAVPNRDDSGHRVLNAFRNLVKMLRLADRAALKKYGLGSAQIFVLHELNHASPLSVNELAERTATDQSTVSVVLNKLVSKGLVERTRSESDARRAEIALTSKGRHIVKKLPPPVPQLLLNGVRDLPPARAKQLADTLEAIVESAGGAEEHPPMFFEDQSTKRRR